MQHSTLKARHREGLSNQKTKGKLDGRRDYTPLTSDNEERGKRPCEPGDKNHCLFESDVPDYGQTAVSAESALKFRFLCTSGLLSPHFWGLNGELLPHY